MNETIEVQFRRNGRRLRVRRQLPGGIEFDEADPIERTVGIELTGASEATKMRMNSIRRIHGWDPGQFKLKVGVEDGSLLLRGVTEHALPEGRYHIRTIVEEAGRPRAATARVEHDGRDTIAFDLHMDDRTVDVDLADADTTVLQVLERSVIDGGPALAWVDDENRRATRRACLLNLLAALRTRPLSSEPLLPLVRNVFLVANDRMYARVDRGLLARLQALADSPDRPFYAEGRPHAAIHGRLLTELPEPPDVRARFQDLTSFRAEGRPSMQIVVAVPPPDLAHTYAEFDLDLGNPLQDLAGFFVHVGELLDGKPTNHLDMHRVLARSNARPFLYYSVVTGS